ncbi:ABC transporter substrate-binding protein [Pigmentibacter sp. JX0631]|uniref:ABC transporter substrate-binding protein n=1 Tax=Pigmentibacter sp. JX0631 TaxID=2976982 RepID=UPI002468270B|nr:ABC transporter substrate-binding protein [Pigmentibacter sp. JX0631]WGL61024.1 ABC transporter substrate-binding protein [Pigmentibacter sp. JX0631]
MKYTFRLILIFILIIFSFFSYPAENNSKEKKFQILYYNSENQEGFWWRTTSEFMQAACQNLGMDLNIVYVDRDAAFMVNDFKNKAATLNKPDAVVFQNLKSNAVNMLNIAEENKIPAFIFNAGLTEEQDKQYGKPREKFKYWIGQILPDDKKAGYDLAIQLFNEAKRLGLKDKNGNIHFLNIIGTKTDTSSIERENGLKLASQHEKKIILDQITTANWDRNEAEKSLNWLILRYPEANVVWAANDLMGLGALDSLSKTKIKPGKDIIIGSMDWVPEALKHVQSGKLFTSLNGHFIETAWAAVLVYDYLNKNDFASEKTSFTSKMTVLSKSNINLYLKNFKPDNFKKINFSNFSKVKNKNLKKYDFSFDLVLKKIISN